MLWVLDASINVSMEPFRAFVADKLPGDQRTAGFVMRSFFIGIGAAVANALPSILESLATGDWGFLTSGDWGWLGRHVYGMESMARAVGDVLKPLAANIRDMVVPFHILE